MSEDKETQDLVGGLKGYGSFYSARDQRGKAEFFFGAADALRSLQEENKRLRRLQAAVSGTLDVQDVAVMLCHIDGEDPDALTSVDRAPLEKNWRRWREEAEELMKASAALKEVGNG